MNPYEKERFELDNGKVMSKDDEVDLLLMVRGLRLIRKHHDFLRNIPWARIDN